MEQPKEPTMEILQLCKITPSSSPAAEFSLPLTIFDLVFFLGPPTERILFYSLPADEYSDEQLDSILQNLKHSLSLTLSHFLPLAGNLVWPNHSPEPFILYEQGDSVSLTVATTDADFDHLCSNHVRRANESHFLVPELPASDNNVAPAMSLQITLFPNAGLSIGIVTNHVVADGKTSTLFLKSWAAICRNLENTLPPELTPVFDRTAVNNLDGMQSLYDQYFGAILSKSKTFRLPPKPTVSQDVVTGTFELTRADVETLRRKVEAASTCSSPSTRRRRSSTFTLAFAHVSTCIAKAQGMEEKKKKKKKMALAFLVDWRPRVGTLGGLNYFGNGVSSYGVLVEASELEEENAMAMVANKISDGVGEMAAVEGNLVEMLEGIGARWGEEMGNICKTIIVGGSPRLGVYAIDFGWGCSNKVDMVSINPTGSFSMAETRNGDGGVQLGIALPNQAMDIFVSLFSDGLKN